MSQKPSRPEAHHGHSNPGGARPKVAWRRNDEDREEVVSMTQEELLALQADLVTREQELMRACGTLQ